MRSPISILNTFMTAWWVAAETDKCRRVGKAQRAHRRHLHAAMDTVGTRSPSSGPPKAGPGGFAHLADSALIKPHSRPRPQYPHEAPAYALLRVGEMRVERREIRHVGSPGEKLR